MYKYRYYRLFHYINSLWKQSIKVPWLIWSFIKVPRLIWSSVEMIVKNLEKVFRYANWRAIITSLRYDWNIWKKWSKPEIKVCGIYSGDWRCINVKLVQVFQRNYYAVLSRQTRRPTQMLARERHLSSLNGNSGNAGDTGFAG